MDKFVCLLECGHEVDWAETPGLPGADLPWVGRFAYCEACGGERLIEEVYPSQWDVETILLSETEPSQTDAGASGMAWTSGEKAVVFYDTLTGTWGYCIYGIGYTGLAFETDDVVGFASLEEAKQAVLELKNASSTEEGDTEE